MRAVAAARRAMAHRGPDGEGMAEALGGHVVMGHRRLAVMDPTPAGAQPMRSVRGVMVYNGEVYNDADVRRQLLAGPMRGGAFATRCDTETVLAAMDAWGVNALETLRGMFGLVHVDSARGRVVIARDPMGVKPLYWWRGITRVDGGGERAVVVVASEIAAVIAAAREFGYSPTPDYGVVCGYMTTIRTTLGERTMFDGVKIVEAGAWIELDATSGGLDETRGWHGWFKPGKRGATPIEHASLLRADGASDCIAVLDASVRAHLRSDVALCSLLSGGVDSTMIAALAARAMREDANPTPLRTFCAGARRGGGDDDFAWARKVAGAIGSIHSEVEVTREGFVDRWRETVESSGVVMSTPNQVAIQEVARAIRASGHVVALSGEGADELLGGYDLALRGPIEAELEGAEWTRDARLRGVFMASASSWVPLGAKGEVLSAGTWAKAEGDGGDLALIDAYAREWEMWCQPWLDGDGYARDCATRAHLRFLTRVNMQGLLSRLDESTMRWSVEGRTPFADAAVARWASGLGAAETIDGREKGVGATKRVLREAMMLAAPEGVGGAGGVGGVFEGVRGRAKASFPLPFQEWMVGGRDVLRSDAAREMFASEAIEVVYADPSRAWALAWPMMNLAMWAERWWGGGGAGVGEQRIESGERAELAQREA